MHTLVISGTLVVPLYKKIYGHFEAHADGEFSIECLHQLGLSHPEQTCRQIIENYFESNPDDFILIGHSQGGLVARWIGQLFPGRVRAVFTYGTPHHGFWGAHRLSPLFASVRAMSRGSRFISGLLHGEDPPIHSFYSLGDLAALPRNSAHVEGSNAHNYFIAPAQLRPFRKVLIPDDVMWLDGRLEEHTTQIYSPAAAEVVNGVLEEIRSCSDLVSQSSS